MRLIPICVFVGLFASACAMPRDGYLYSPTTAGRGSVAFPDSSDDKGTLNATLVNGEHCRGRYATVPGPRVTYDDEKISVISSEDTQDGMALMECSPGHLLRCTFTRNIDGDGLGRCLDNRDQWLTMYF